jgi:hypothetical protein
MPAPLEEFRAFAIHLTAEHRTIARYLEQIEQDFDLAATNPPQLVASPISNLNRLRTALASHFDEEESGGCLDEAVLRLPTLAACAGRVLSEHAGLLADVDWMIDRLKRAPVSLQSLDEVRCRFRCFVERLRAHEAAEDGILEQSFGEEAI